MIKVGTAWRIFTLLQMYVWTDLGYQNFCWDVGQRRDSSTDQFVFLRIRPRCAAGSSYRRVDTEGACAPSATSVVPGGSNGHLDNAV